jgi:hypothetical protein
MSQHNITGSEVFGPKPFVILRSVKAGGLRRQRKARTLLAFVTGAVVALVGGAVAVAAAFGPALLG